MTDYSTWKITDFINEIKRLKSQKRYGLVWEGREPENVVLNAKENYPILREVMDKCIITDNNKPTNLLIEGDNYDALRILSYTHAGKIDVIYIDPPYNNGKKTWKYNNNYVDSEDVWRHSKFVSWINNRIILAKGILSDKGIIIMAIDDWEIATMRLLMDEVFGERNRLGTIVVECNPAGKTSKDFFAVSHEYMLIYAKDKKYAKIKSLDVDIKDDKRKGARKIDKIEKDHFIRFGEWGSSKVGNPDYDYPLYYNDQTNELTLQKNLENDVEIQPVDARGVHWTWRWTKASTAKRLNELIVTKISSGKRKGKYTIDTLRGCRDRQLGSKSERIKKIRTVWTGGRYSSTYYGTVLIQNILSSINPFDYAKSIYAVRDLLYIATDKNSTVLDFFAGSGTTGHAVLELNKEDGGNRQFILCTNNENNICEEITQARIKKVINGYSYKAKGGKKDVEGLGGNVKYMKIDYIPSEKPKSGFKKLDKYRKLLAQNVIEMICMKENTFNKIEVNKMFTIFSDGIKYVGIINDLDGIIAFKNFIRKLGKNINVYVFSYSDVVPEDEFEDVKNLVKLIPIPYQLLSSLEVK